jgi:transcriptional regulator with XRE-family HTH domain
MPTPLRDQLVRVFDASGLKQEDLAVAIGRDRTTVAKVAGGSRSTQIEVADAWAAACKHEIVLVPLDTQDAEGLRSLVDSLTDPLARSVVADVVRMTQIPGAHVALVDFREEVGQMTRLLRLRAARNSGLSK